MQAPASTVAVLPSEATATARPPAPAHTRRVDSRLLMREAKELVIDHQGQEYRLRLTRNDKLILTK